MTNQIKTIVLLGALSALLIAIGGALGPDFLTGAVVMAAVMNLGAYFFSDRIVLALQRAEEVAPEQAPELHAIVGELSRRAGIPEPRVYVIPQAQPNAFATGRNPDHAVVAVTEGIVRLLDARELRGVLAHELAHVRNRDILISSIAATVAAAVSYVAHVAGFLGVSSRDDDGPHPLQSLLLVLVAPIAATLIQLGVSRSREFEADRSGAALSGDPEALARALEKLEAGARAIPAQVEPATASLFIVNPFGGVRTVLRWFSTHPSTEERVRRLRAMADESRGGAPGWSRGAQPGF
ncbi:MAG TPA: zinc metalloprotease HtpX [Myxococcaceae bacterium]|jgi:heat shock protein HtpX|nr:zinc metalloprotease HtpX [Myxococcaceae bacterium]